MKGYDKTESLLSPVMRQIDDALIADLKAYIAEHAETPDTHTFLGGASALAAIGILDNWRGSYKVFKPKEKLSDLGEIKTFVDETRNKDTFSVFLDKLREEKGLSASELYNQARAYRRQGA